MTIRYSEVLYKYRLHGDAEALLDFAPPHDIITPYVEFYTTGLMRLKDGYLSDGPSGPTRDDETNMQGGFFHDGGYQLLRLGLLDRVKYRPLFDTMFKRILRVDGMLWSRAAVYYEGVHLCGRQFTEPEQVEIHTCGIPIDFQASEGC